MDNSKSAWRSRSTLTLLVTAFGQPENKGSVLHEVALRLNCSGSAVCYSIRHLLNSPRRTAPQLKYSTPVPEAQQTPIMYWRSGRRSGSPCARAMVEAPSVYLKFRRLPAWVLRHPTSPRLPTPNGPITQILNTGTRSAVPEAYRR